ncbi:inner membrane protein PPF-1, chloroplastic-like isoform X1 [Chenopodium quinoa]|uniref:inner membrane protein PPF-1, chloroplastic-like isoform X1 n=1 Tax=Chenopodium quinoa TaxID=63459 RepID=UPI000B7774FA|nr:inner membrane protein PPF-1, chloroplastic-like isoform X1 [Chenopodium quinoa]XP_021743077.1 inner membrane protein PPF-1, chloroplastic-like isoform X1 [Chenopodium quinoa]
MELMKPPQADPSQKNSLLILKFLPLMIGYFSLSVPSGLSIYWFTNNVLSTAQQVWLRKFGGAKPGVNENAGGIISAGKAKRSVSQPAQIDDRKNKIQESMGDLSKWVSNSLLHKLESLPTVSSNCLLYL